jgi:predicted metal-dependent hydrolase
MYKKIKRLISRVIRKKTKPQAVHYSNHKYHARIIITHRVNYWSEVSKIPYGKISIRNQKRRWGSCSSLGNLNFNYKLCLLPTCLLDYVIVHELCHLRELNHGPRFWALVAAYYPAYQEIEHELRKLEQATRLQPAAITAYVQAHSCLLCAPTQQLGV